MRRVLTGSSDGPYVFVEADDGVAFLRRVAAHLHDDPTKLGLCAVTVAAPAAGLIVRLRVALAAW